MNVLKIVYAKQVFFQDKAHQVYKYFLSYLQYWIRVRDRSPDVHE